MTIGYDDERWDDIVSSVIQRILKDLEGTKEFREEVEKAAYGIIYDRLRYWNLADILKQQLRAQLEQVGKEQAARVVKDMDLFARLQVLIEQKAEELVHETLENIATHSLVNTAEKMLLRKK